MDSSSDDEFYDCQSEPIKYFAVACHKDRGKGLVTMDMNEARVKLKSVKGSRFNSFYDPLEAKRFADKPLSDDSDVNAKKKAASQKKLSDPFPNVSQRELGVLKAAIETGDLEKVKMLVWSNPRHLVTESDSPTLLKVNFRHNALHVAAIHNRDEIMRFIIESVSQLEFWRSIYPTADDNCNEQRKVRVLDLLLNAPEIGNMDTPLHMAAKFGQIACLRLLLSQPQTDVDLRNRAGQRAQEVLGQRCPDKNEQLIISLDAVFSEKFVILLQGGKVAEPMSHCQLHALLRSVDDDQVAVRAFIGPLEQSKANQLFYRWTCPNADDAARFEEARRTDAEKGLECHGRYLAEQFGANWHEYWSFLGKYTDLATEEGLMKLDEHLASIEETRMVSPVQPSIIDQNDDNSQVEGVSAGFYGSLVRLFSRLTINSPSPVRPIQCSPIFRPPLDPLITSTPLRCPLPLNNSINTDHNKSLRACRTPFNTSLVGSGVLTTVDRQVRQALLSPAVTRARKLPPRVSNWLDSMSEIDPLGDHHSDSFQFLPGMANGRLVSSTPIKSRINHRRLGKNHLYPINQQLPKCLSPLSQIELSDDY